MTFPRKGMNMAAPAIVKKLTYVITVPEIEGGKVSLA